MATLIQTLLDVLIVENQLLVMYIYWLGQQFHGKVLNKLLLLHPQLKAEFVACFEAVVHGLWLQNFISGLAIVNTSEKPLRIYCDNSAAIFFSKNDKYSNGAKHMELKYFAVKEEV